MELPQNSLGIDNTLAVLGGRRRWRVERPYSFSNRWPSRGFPRVAVLARGTSSEFCSESTTLPLFCANAGAGAWNQQRILFGIDGGGAGASRGASSEFFS